MSESLSRSVRVALLLVPFVISGAVVLPNIFGSVITGEYTGAADFEVFYEGASFFADGRYDELYDQNEFTELTGLTDQNLYYAYAPFYARAWIPLSKLSIDAAWVAWTLASILLIAGTAAVTSKRALPAAVLGVTCMPAAMSLGLGQNAAVSAAIVAGSFLLARRGHLAAAGIVFGLLVFKPQLAVGIGIWWLVDRRYRKAAWFAIGTATAIVAASWFLDPSAWSPYRAALTEVATIRDNLLQSSLTGFADLLLPNWSQARLLGGAVGVVILTMFGFWVSRRRDPTMAFVVATAVTLLASPYVVRYDYLILLAPLALLISSRDVRHLWWPAVALSWASLVSGNIVHAMRSSLGFSVQILPLVLGGALIAFLATVDTTQADSPSARGVVPQSGIGG